MTIKFKSYKSHKYKEEYTTKQKIYQISTYS